MDAEEPVLTSLPALPEKSSCCDRQCPSSYCRLHTTNLKGSTTSWSTPAFIPSDLEHRAFEVCSPQTPFLCTEGPMISRCSSSDWLVLSLSRQCTACCDIRTCKNFPNGKTTATGVHADAGAVTSGDADKTKFGHFPGYA